MGRYVTAADVKSTLGIGDTVDDVEVERAVDAAEALIDDHTDRSFEKADPASDSTTQRTYAPEGYRLSSSSVRLGVGDCLFIDDLVDIDSLERQDTAGGSWTTIPADHYELQPINASADGVPYTQILFTTAESAHRFRVTGWFGWPAVPNAIVQASVLQASRLLKRAKEAPFGVAPVGGFEGAALRLMNKLDPDVELLVRQYDRTRLIG